MIKKPAYSPCVISNKSCQHLFYDDCLDGAFVGCLLDIVFVLGGNFVNDNFRHLVAHLEHFGAGIDAKSAGRASIFNSDYHRISPSSHLRFAA
jgi:hypothetical protein